MKALRSLSTRYLPISVRMGGRRLLYSGRARRCEMCGAQVRRFLTNGAALPVLAARRVVGGMPRPDDRCPVCHARDRTRLLRFWIERHGGIAGAAPGSVRLLDVAPDPGLGLWLAREPAIAYLGTDLDARRYRHIADFVAADLTDLPFEDGRFDLVICAHVFEHIPDDVAAMRQVLRVLKPGGRLLALVPVATDGGAMDEDIHLEDPAAREARFGQWDHIRLYTLDAFEARLRSAGFDTARYEAFAEDPEAAAAHLLNPAEILTVATRPG